MTAFLLEEFKADRAEPVCTAVLGTHDLDFKILQEGRRSIKAWDNLRAAFLPEGYPNSVTSDYLPFQLWDTLQGLSTYIRSMLSTQALLGAIGVGETNATVVGATFQWFLRDLTGMLGGILFTLYQGSNLDSSAKQWRLAADLMNDVGMLMDLVSPLFPGSFLALVCIGSAARAVTGVASGATRAALTQHFALGKNAADVSAKEGSQETAATLVGMMLGMIVARVTAGHALGVWTSFLLLTVFHMYANFKAVGSLCLTSLNGGRLTLILERYRSDGQVPSPRQVAGAEQVLPYPKMRWRRQKELVFGAQVSCAHRRCERSVSFPALIRRYGKGLYLIIAAENGVQVVLHTKAQAKDCLKAYVHALILRRALESKGSGALGSDAAEFECMTWMEEEYEAFIEAVKASGWATDRILVPWGEWRAEWIEPGSATTVSRMGMEKDAIWSAVFGDSDTDEEEARDEGEQVEVDPEEVTGATGWERIQAVPGLVVLRQFLGDMEQEAVEKAIDEGACGKLHVDVEQRIGFQTRVTTRGEQAMRFGDLPAWAVGLRQRIRERARGAECCWEPIPRSILQREPLFDQMIVNVYQPGEGIKAHVDLLRFEDGIAIVSLLSPCVMCFRKQQQHQQQQQEEEEEQADGDGGGVDDKVRVLLMPGDLVVMCGEARYGWSHEINRREEDGEQVWRGQRIRQERRVSVTLRRLCPQH